jgi:alkylation response protein AidB-like acyl-CoA dehydrogenase
MDFALQPHTTAGARFVALAEQHATDFAMRAAQHDREGSFPFENIEAMQQSGVMAACVPVEFGGLGVESLHDAVLGINRLGRGDGSTAIAATMHIFLPWRLTRNWHAATASGETAQAEQAAAVLRQIGTGQLVRCSLISEPGTDLLHPLVEATKVEGGWRLNERKIFGTLSPAASLLDVTCRSQDTQGASAASKPACREGVRVWTSAISGSRWACGDLGAMILCSRTALSQIPPWGLTAHGGIGPSCLCP